MTLCQKLGLLGVLAASGLHAADRITGPSFAMRSEVYAPKAMAATSHPLATQIALQTMREGGSAMDAAIAANAALGLMEPTGNGIGGDLFAIVWDPKTRKLHGYNGSGRSPKALSLAEFQRRGLADIPSHGPLPVTVPGTVDAWFALHARFGKRSMAQNLAPTIAYAREGHPVHETIAYYWGRSVPTLSKWPGFSEQFTVDGKRAPRTGERWRNPNLASTLEIIGHEGRDAFYKGAIARSIDTYFKANDGFLRYEDLATHQGEWVTPVSTNYRGYDVWELPPNGQGIAALQILNLLEPYDLKAYGFGSTEHIHPFVEAKKLAFADRAASYADPDFYKTPVARLISKDYARERGKLISMDKAMKATEPGIIPELNEGDTIYLTTADADGMMVSLIQSNYRGMGSGMAPPGLGFIFQDRGEQFVLKTGSRAVAVDITVMDYVEAAKLRGEGYRWVMFREILPNALSPLVAEMGLRFIFMVLFISTLSFLGLGIQPPEADWGGIVKENADGINYGIGAALYPAVAIATLAISVNLVADWVLNRTTSLKGGR